MLSGVAGTGLGSGAGTVLTRRAELHGRKAADRRWQVDEELVRVGVDDRHVPGVASGYIHAGAISCRSRRDTESRRGTIPHRGNGNRRKVDGSRHLVSESVEGSDLGLYTGDRHLANDL